MTEPASLSDDLELLAQWMIRHSYATGHGDSVADLLSELEWQHKERELAYEVYKNATDVIEPQAREITNLRTQLEEARRAITDIQAATDALFEFDLDGHGPEDPNAPCDTCRAMHALKTAVDKSRLSDFPTPPPATQGEG